MAGARPDDVDSAPAFAIGVEFDGDPERGGPVRAFTLGGRRIGVLETIDRWFGSGYCYLKLRGEDKAIYILRHDEAADQWSLTLFQSEAQPVLPPGPRHPPQPLSH